MGRKKMVRRQQQRRQPMQRKSHDDEKHRVTTQTDVFIKDRKTFTEKGKIGRDQSSMWFVAQTVTHLRGSLPPATAGTGTGTGYIHMVYGADVRHKWSNLEFLSRDKVILHIPA